MPVQSYRSKALAKILRLYEQARNLFAVELLLYSDDDSLDLDLE